MKRFAVLVSCSVVCTMLAFVVLSATATPSWSELDQTVTVSKAPITDGCYERCDIPGGGPGSVCISTTFTWTCWVIEGSCSSVKQCIM